MTTKERVLFAGAMYNSLWAKVNPEKVRALNQRNYKTNPETHKAASVAWREANLEQHKANQSKWQKANPKKAKGYLLKKYNLTPEEWQKILDFQKGLCAICGRPAPDFTRALAVDHDHSTRIVRGLLCWNCNSLLPNRKELISLLKKAIRYLEAPPAVKVLGVHLANPVRRKRKTKRKI